MMNDKQGLGNGASAETQEIRRLISEHFPGAMISERHAITFIQGFFLRPFD